MSYDKEFSEKYRMLTYFKRKYGHTNIPSKPTKKWLNPLSELHQQNLKTVGRFVETLRTQKKNKALAQYKIDMLNHIDFVWQSPNIFKKIRHDNQMLEELKEFKQTYGHCKVPEEWSENIKLAKFVVSSRNSFRKRKISQKKIFELKRLDFDFNPGQNHYKRDKKGMFCKTI